MFIKLDGTRVILEHHAPEQLTSEQIVEGLLVTAVKPEPEKENATLHYDVDKSEFYYTYANESEIETMKAELNATTDYVLDVDFRLIMLELGI